MYTPTHTHTHPHAHSSKGVLQRTSPQKMSLWRERGFPTSCLSSLEVTLWDSLGHKGRVSIMKEKTYHLNFGPTFSIMSAFMNVYFTSFICSHFGVTELERVKGWKLCKHDSNVVGCFWLFQIHAPYLWEENCFCGHLIIGTREDKYNIFSYRDPDSWKS